MLRIVAVADTHAFESHIERVPDGDILIHAGDLSRSGALEEFRDAVAWVKSLPHPHKIVIAGNHDWSLVHHREAALELLHGLTYLEDSGCQIDGVNFWGSPWTPEFCDWAFNLPRGPQLAEKWALIPAETDVLITHGPPHGYGDRVHVQRRCGCDDLLVALDRVRPALHVFGHIHEDGGCWQRGETLIANVTTWGPLRPPTVFDYDPASRTVVPIVVPARNPVV